MFRDITAPYHALESWFYDRAVAPAISEIIEERGDILQPLLTTMPEEGRLLDVGCGGGHIAIDLANKHRGWRISGVDRSPEQVLRAKKRSRRLAGQVRFITGSAIALPFGNDTFDGLISICSIKHWPEPARGLSECLRVLRAGKPFIVIEVDPGYRSIDARTFVARQHVPFFLKPFALAGFIWKVAARSLPMKNAESSFTALPVSILQAAPVPGMPLWIISGVKTGPVTPSRAGGR